MQFIYKFNDIDCAACANKIEDALNKAKIVKHIEVDYIGKKLIIENDKNVSSKMLDSLQEVINGVEEDTYIIYPGNPYYESGKDSLEETKDDEEKHKHNRKVGAFIFGIIFYIIALICDKELDDLNFVLIDGLYIISYIFLGGDIILKFLKNILHIFTGKSKEFFDENSLMTIATIGALAIGEFSEGIAVMLLYKIGEFLQDSIVEKSRKSIVNLIGLKKDTASLKVSEGIKEIELKEIQVGDILVIKNGEEIPIDGKIVSGETLLDLSSLTGESDLVSKGVGDEVLSGGLNKKEVITIEATKEYKDSTVSKILDIIENSSSKKSKAEHFITKFAKIYTPIVCLAALIILIVPTLFMGQDFSTWVYRACSFLVVSCPCALVISIPLSFFVGIGHSSKHGILIKGSNYLNEVSKIDNFVFDKTGTLTSGNFIVSDIKFFGNAKMDDIKNICYSMEKMSTHPIAKSICRKLEDYNARDISFSSINEVSGKGIIATSNKITYRIGNSDFCDIKEKSNGIYFVENGVLKCKFIINDGIKDGAKELVSYLLKNNKRVIMLTGDNEEAAKEIASELEIKEYYSELLPQDKLSFIEKLEGKTLFVGDGINDAPCLIESDIGVSMGGVGSDAAIEASDAVILDDDISKLRKFIRIGHLTNRIAIENIVFTICIKVLVLILIALGISNMWMAIFADVGVSLICICNNFKQFVLRH